MLVQSWYQGGMSVIDWTDPNNVDEIAWFDRGPISETELITGGLWSTYYYNGRIYGSEIYRGFDVFEIDDPAVDGAENYRYRTLNAQTQESF